MYAEGWYRCPLCGLRFMIVQETELPWLAGCPRCGKAFVMVAPMGILSPHCEEMRAITMGPLIAHEVVDEIERWLKEVRNASSSSGEDSGQDAGPEP